MISIKELEEKRDCLMSIRPFTEKETIQLKNNFIVGNTASVEGSKDAYTEEEKLLCINDNWDLRKALSQNPNSYYYFEILGIMSSYNYIQSILRDERTGHYIWKLSEDRIKLVNRLILEEFLYLLPFEKGFYRSGDNKDKFEGRLLPKREIFEKRLERLIVWYAASSDDLFSKMSIFHLKFSGEDIHPFYDGNGRTGRTILNIELARHGYPLISLKYNNLDEYQLAFDEYRNFGNIENMGNLIIQEVDKEMTKQIKLKE